jgi:hypothetical protein
MADLGETVAQLMNRTSELEAKLDEFEQRYESSIDTFFLLTMGALVYRMSIHLYI